VGVIACNLGLEPALICLFLALERTDVWGLVLALERTDVLDLDFVDLAWMDFVDLAWMDFVDLAWMDFVDLAVVTLVAFRNLFAALKVFIVFLTLERLAAFVFFFTVKVSPGNNAYLFLATVFTHFLYIKVCFLVVGII
jgi:hypothetical protein